MALVSAPQPQSVLAPGQLYQLIADTIPHMVWTARADGWLDFFNRRCHEYTGLADGELEGWSWKNVIHPEDWERCLASWTRALQTGERYEIEYRIRRADGVYRWHHGTAVPTRDPAGHVARWFGTCTDIEAEVRSAQILEGMVEERTRTLRAILDTEPECVKVLDAGGRLLQMNAAGLRMVEADSLEALRGECIYHLVGAAHRDAFRALTERVCRGERGTLEFELVGLKGTHRWLESHAVPFLEEATGATRLLAITRDITERRAAELALRESEKRFRSLTELSADLYWEADLQYRFTKIVFGPRVGAMIPVEQQIGKTRWEVPFASPGEDAWAAHRADIAARRPFRDFEFSRIVGGEERFYRASGEPVFTADGVFTGYRGIGRDITERKRVEAERGRLERALRDTEDRFQAFMDHLPMPAWVRDAGFRYRYVNGLYARQNGIDPAAMIGREAGDFFAPEVAESFRQTDLTVLRERAPLQYTDDLPSGQWLKVKFPLPGPDGELGVAGIAFDVTERSRLEEALRLSEERFRYFMQNLPARTWIKDADFRYTYVNEAYAESIGRLASEILGHEDTDLCEPEIAADRHARDLQVLQAGGALQWIRAIVTQPKGPGHWLIVKFPLLDASGRPGVAGISIDVSERVEAEERAREYLANVRRLMGRLVVAQESERRRIADDLHDLIGQNLTALGIGLATLKTHPSVEVRDAVTPRIDAMANLLEGTIDAIRGVMAELRPAALEEFGLVAALRWHASEFRNQTGMNVIVGDSAGEVRYAHDVELALFRIAQEALTNAVKHSGGTTVQVTLSQSGEGVRLVIEDDGLGFANPTGARRTQRSGWGLPAMRERAEAHGGSLRVEFPGRGTRLVVDIPVSRAH